MRHLKPTDIADGPFHEGQPVWVIQADGSQRAGEYVGGAETSAWFGGRSDGVRRLSGHAARARRSRSIA